MGKLKKLRDQILRKVFWLPESQINMIAIETKKLKMPNESVLMKFIINKWFEK